MKNVKSKKIKCTYILYIISFIFYSVNNINNNLQVLLNLKEQYINYVLNIQYINICI